MTQVCVETGNDGFIRHGTAAAIRTFINVADGANNFVHPNDGVDYGAANTGATIISDVAVNALGHVTGFTNRSLTLGNLGFTGATNANYIVYTAGSGLSLSGTEFSVSGDLGTIASATIGELNVDILDAEKILSRDLRVGPTGSTGGVENAAKIGTNGAGTVPNTTLTGAGAHLNKFGDFYLGNVSANKYIFWDQSAGTMTIRGSLDANDINGVVLDTGSNAQLSIGTTIAPGNQSVLIGTGSGGTGLGNTSIGKFAGGGTTGTDNVAIGQDAGKSVTSGDENIMIGSHTGRAPGGTVANKTGNNNIGIGAVSNQNTANGTLSGLTSGSNNIVFGKGAGRSITTGSGNVIIGGYAGVSNDQSTITLATGTGARRLYFDTSGNATFTGTINSGAIVSTGNVTAFSDERLKSDIKTLDGKKVLEMRGVEFIKDGVKGSGVIAQELEKIAPELVHDGEYKSVAYGNITGYLIELAKEQQSEINELKDLVKQLLGNNIP